jgi:hypothetical protein
VGRVKIRQAKGKKKSDQSPYSLNLANEYNQQFHLKKMSALEVFWGKPEMGWESASQKGSGDQNIQSGIHAATEEDRCPRTSD